MWPSNTFNFTRQRRAITSLIKDVLESGLCILQWQANCGDAWGSAALRCWVGTLQYGTQVYSNASSNEDSRSKSSGGQGMGKTREHSGLAADESQKQKTGDR